MAGYDFSQISDEQLEAIMDDLLRDPVASAAMPVDRRQATVAEYNRRQAARSAPPATQPAATKPAPATNVDANLEAAATPIKTEPMAGYPQAPAPQSYEDYAEQSDLYQRGIGLPPQDGEETDAEVEYRFDSKYGRGAYKKHKADTRVRDHGRAYRASIKADLDARDAENQAARRAGYQDPEQVAYNEATGAPEKPAAEDPGAGEYYDGLVVTADDVDKMSDKQIVYNMRHTGENAGSEGQYKQFTPQEIATHRAWMKDVNRIPGGRDQERFNPRGYNAWRQRYEKGIRDRANQSIADEGWGNERTPEQQAARQQRMDTEATAAATPRRVSAMLARMAERAGVTVEEARAIWSQAGIDATDGLTPDEIFRGTEALRDKATNRQIARRQQQQDNILLKRLQRYNPAAALGDAQGLNDWQKFAIAGGKGATPLDVQGAQNAQLTALGLKVATGQGFRDLAPEQRAALGLQQDAKQAEMAGEISSTAEGIVEEYADGRGWLNLPTRLVGGGVEGWDNTLFTVEEEEKATRRLMAKYPHLSYEEARQYELAAGANTTRPPAASKGG